MSLTRTRGLIVPFALSVALTAAGPRPAGAQYRGRTFAPGYPYYTPYTYNTGYGIGSGQLSPGYRPGANINAIRPNPTAPLTYNNINGVANILTQVPSWNRTTGRARPRPRPLPTIPRDRLLADDGRILWPAATPADASVAGRRAPAEQAVRDVVDARRISGHASVKQVVDAKVKLAAFSLAALPIVRSKDVADAAALERFIVELEKTLQTLADKY